MRILAVATFLALGAGAAAAECADQTQAGLNQCADADFKRADHGLNAVYDQILHRLGTDERSKQALIAAEKAWIVFRDAECKFRADPSQQGSIWGMEHLICLEDETKGRTKALSAYLHCQEGDLRCPVPPQ
jgi:uncharacterized protein YecT (DUF1311 family)